MATDNRHRPGFALTCKKCSKYGQANGYALVRGPFASVRKVPLRCTQCGNRWTSRHLHAHHRPLDAMPGGVAIPKAHTGAPTP